MLRRLGRYELLDQVGSGGMAIVYRGRDTALDREVAVKLLHPHLAGSAESRARFSREARAVARLAHPCIVEIFDYAGDGAPEAYLVTEFVHGRTLRAFAQQEGFGFPEVGLLVGRALCDALVHAHSAGVIHRDLKPENVLVQAGPRPAVKLADFGIARILASEERMTMTGALVGSPHHMAPEIVEGREADARSDLFSLGTILYWLSTGKLPFAASNPTAILRRAIEGDYQDPREADPRVSSRLGGLLRRCLSVDPEGRPASAAEVRDALDAVLAEVGLARPEEALHAFLADPQGFKAAYPGRAVQALLTRADAALAEGASARAIGLFDQILALDPANAEVPVRLRALSRRRRLRRLGAAAAAAGLVAALLLAGTAAWRSRGTGEPHGPPAGAPAPDARTVPGGAAPDAGAPHQPSAAIPAALPGAAATGQEGTSGPGTPADPAGAGAPRKAPRHLEPPAGGAAAGPVQGAAVPLLVHVRPYAQRALLDGVEVASGAQSVRFDLTPGATHVIQLEHPCCTPFVRRLTAEEAAGLGELRVPLDARPAHLRVEGDPTTRVWVGGALLGTAGASQRLPLDVRIPPGGESAYEAQVRVTLEPPGQPPRSLLVKLRAGAEHTLAAPTSEAEP